MSYVGDPAGNAAVTPDDGTVFTEPSRALYVGGTGTLTVRTYPGGQVVQFTAVPIGILPLRVDKVLATGTSATSIVKLW